MYAVISYLSDFYVRILKTFNLKNCSPLTLYRINFNVLFYSTVNSLFWGWNIICRLLLGNFATLYPVVEDSSSGFKWSELLFGGQFVIEKSRRLMYLYHCYYHVVLAPSQISFLMSLHPSDTRWHKSFPSPFWKCIRCIKRYILQLKKQLILSCCTTDFGSYIINMPGDVAFWWLNHVLVPILSDLR